jgi:hypothetical protein
MRLLAKQLRGPRLPTQQLVQLANELAEGVFVKIAPLKNKQNVTALNGHWERTTQLTRRLPRSLRQLKQRRSLNNTSLPRAS